MCWPGQGADSLGAAGECCLFAGHVWLRKHVACVPGFLTLSWTCTSHMLRNAAAGPVGCDSLRQHPAAWSVTRDGGEPYAGGSPSDRVVAKKPTRPTPHPRIIFRRRSRNGDPLLASQAEHHTKFSPLCPCAPPSINTALTSAIRMAKNPVSLSSTVAKVCVCCVRLPLLLIPCHAPPWPGCPDPCLHHVQAWSLCSSSPWPLLA